MKTSFFRRTIPSALAATLIACAGAPQKPATSANVDRHFTWKQMNLHYRDCAAPNSPRGNQEAVVFVHGWSCNAGFWREQVPALEGRVRVLCVDLPGHGESDKPEIEYSMDLFARAVEATMRNAGVEKAVLVGHSMGTPVIRQFYRLFPEKVRALVVVDGALRPFMTDPKQIDAFMERFQGPGYAEGVSKMVDSMISAQAAPALRESVKAQMASAPRHVGVSAFRGMLDPGIWTEDRIEVPLFVVNAQSKLWPPDYEAFVRRLAPKASFTTMQDTGHFLMLEKPAEFNGLLLGFLGEQGMLASVTP